jgi:hypothetical protein
VPAKPAPLMQAAIIYQHASAEADARIAASLEAEITGRTDNDAGEVAEDVDEQ